MSYCLIPERFRAVLGASSFKSDNTLDDTSNSLIIHKPNFNELEEFG